MDEFEVPLPMKKEAEHGKRKENKAKEKEKEKEEIKATTFEKVQKMFGEEEYDYTKPNDYHEILAYAKKVDMDIAMKKKQTEIQTPINLDLTGEEAYKLRLQKTAHSLGINKANSSGESKALNIMYKMGWNGFDSGLGINQQGIKAPLALQKKDGHSVVVQSQAIKEDSLAKGALITK